MFCFVLLQNVSMSWLTTTYLEYPFRTLQSFSFHHIHFYCFQNIYHCIRCWKTSYWWVSHHRRNNVYCKWNQIRLKLGTLLMTTSLCWSESVPSAQRFKRLRAQCLCNNKIMENVEMSLTLKITGVKTKLTKYNN